MGAVERDVAPRVHRVEDGFVNWYIVETDDGITLVDAGLPRSWDSLHGALRAIGRPIGDVRALLLTHAHVDHIGFAERLRAEHGVPVHLHARDHGLIRHPLRYPMERSPLRYRPNRRSLGALASMVVQRAAFQPRLAEIEGFEDETVVLPVPGRPRVVPTPGHTFGHTAFVFEDHDAVVSGDALVTWDPYSNAVGPRPVARAATADSSQALASLGAFAALAVTHVLPGHGDPWSGGAAEAAAQAARNGIA